MKLKTLLLFLSLPIGLSLTSHAQNETPVKWFADKEDPETQYAEPFQIFDNFYYVGNKWVSAYLLTTSDGLILFDAVFGQHVEPMVDNIRKLGFDPKDIKKVICTHGHFDHMGGAGYVQKLSGARVGMVEEDWIIIENGEPYRPDLIYPVERDWVIVDGEEITQGDTTLKCLTTPGHTPGTLSLIFTVFDNGTPHKAILYGGVGLNFEGIEQSLMYINSVKRAQALKGIEINFSNHPGTADIFGRAKKLVTRKPDQAHPFVDPDTFQAWLKERLAAGYQKLEEEKNKSRSDG